MGPLRFQKSVIKLVKLFHEQLNKLIPNVLISSEIDDVKKKIILQKVFYIIGVAFAAVQDKMAKEAALRGKKGKPLTYKTQCCKSK